MGEDSKLVGKIWNGLPKIGLPEEMCRRLMLALP